MSDNHNKLKKSSSQTSLVGNFASSIGGSFKSLGKGKKSEELRKKSFSSSTNSLFVQDDDNNNEPVSKPRRKSAFIDKSEIEHIRAKNEAKGKTGGDGNFLSPNIEDSPKIKRSRSRSILDLFSSIGSGDHDSDHEEKEKQSKSKSQSNSLPIGITIPIPKKEVWQQQISSKKQQKQKPSKEDRQRFDGHSKEQLTQIIICLQRIFDEQKEKLETLEKYMDSLLLSIMETHPNILETVTN